MACKGICEQYKVKKPVGAGRYASGQKRCQICEIYIKWDGHWCPCCGYRLRSNPRSRKYKAKLRRATPTTASAYPSTNTTTSPTSASATAIAPAAHH